MGFGGRSRGAAKFRRIPRTARDSRRRRQRRRYPAQRRVPAIARLPERGFPTQSLSNPGEPAAGFRAARQIAARAKTILFYIHFDGQPVVPEEWAQKNPFVPVVKQRDASGKLASRRRERAAGDAARSGASRVRARGVGRQGADPDDADRDRSAESAGTDAGVQRQASCSIPKKRSLAEPRRRGRSNKTLFNADALVILTGPRTRRGRPTLVFGNRGIAQATLIVYGPRAPLHSGHYGNYAPNPALRLARLLPSMKDDDGRVRSRATTTASR